MMTTNKIKIALAQISSRLADVPSNIEKHLEYIDKAISDGSDVIIFPELSLTGYSLKDAVYDVALHVSDEIMINAEIDCLQLKNARLHSTMLSDARIDLVTEELNRIARSVKEY